MWKRGNLSRSSTITRRPARARRAAATLPAGPPPIIATSKGSPLIRCNVAKFAAKQSLVDRALRRAMSYCGFAVIFLASSAERSIHLQLARDELVQLHNIRGELANAFTRLFVGHRVVVQSVSKRLLVELHLFDLGRLRFLGVEFALDRVR